MIEERERYERAFQQFEMSEPALDRLIARRDRKRRNQRIAAGVVGITVFVAAVWIVTSVKSLDRSDSSVVPATPPSPTASAQPSPAPGFSRFSSPLHGITIDYPAGWKVRPASEPWGHGDVAFDATDVDVIFDPSLGDDVYLALVSEPLGKSGTDWIGGGDLPTVGICEAGPHGGSGGGSGTLDGGDAWFQDCDERHGAMGHVVTVETATRGYVVYVHVADDPHLQATYDARWFERVLLKTVDLRPEDAPTR